MRGGGSILMLLSSSWGEEKGPAEALFRGSGQGDRLVERLIRVKNEAELLLKGERC